MTCPLCGFASARELHASAARERAFLRCTRCLLVFVPPRFHLSEAEARAHYALHRNTPDDPRYRAFLSRLFVPLRARVADGASGLDFGCGPGPTLGAMFRESGVACADYDPLFADDRSLLARRYDFISCSEVFEHLAAPGAVVEQLLSMLRTGASLGVMTKRVTTEEAFARWHYVRDPTHVCFFSDETFAWIAERHDLTLSFASADVVLLGSRTTLRQS